jgi:hypothetical protein
MHSQANRHQGRRRPHGSESPAGPPTCSSRQPSGSLSSTRNATQDERPVTSPRAARLRELEDNRSDWLNRALNSRPMCSPLPRQRQADVRTALQGLIERGQAAGELRADLTPEDLIIATSLLSRPLPGTGDWDRLAHRQINLMTYGLGRSAHSA